MNKNVLIIGGLAILGVGAYIYFKIKAEPNEEDADTTTENPSTATGVPKVDKVLQVSNSTKNAQEAVTLAIQIFELKNKKKKYSNMSLNEFFKTKEGKNYPSFPPTLLEQGKENTLKDFDNELKILNNKIVALGYIEVNGSIAKLN